MPSCATELAETETTPETAFSTMSERALGSCAATGETISSERRMALRRRREAAGMVKFPVVVGFSNVVSEPIICAVVDRLKS